MLSKNQLDRWRNQIDQLTHKYQNIEDKLKHIVETIKIKKAKSNHHHRTLDKFYTKPEIVDSIIAQIQNINEFDLVIDPAAGSGSFFSKLPELSRIGIDISPPDNAPKEIFKRDFLQTNPSEFTQTNDKENKSILVITNPPFGKNSSLVLKFFKHAAKFATYIGFIMPNSFKKESMQRKLPLYFHLLKQINLPNNSFILDNKPHHVPCSFQLWVKQKKPRKHTRESDLPDISDIFEFTNSKDSDVNVAIRRVGVNAGAVKTLKLDKISITSHHFLKVNPKYLKTFVKLVSDIKYEKDNTVGPPSIGKGEVRLEIFKLAKKIKESR